MERVSQDLPPLSDPVSATRILCGALLLPSVATVLGKCLFENVRSNFRRAFLVKKTKYNLFLFLNNPIPSFFLF